MPTLVCISAAWTTVCTDLAPLGAPFAPLLDHREEECAAADVILRARSGARLMIRIVYDPARERWAIPSGQLSSRCGIYADGKLNGNDFIELVVPTGTTVTIRPTLAAA